MNELTTEKSKEYLGRWWCLSHDRPATYFNGNKWQCDPKLSGILLPCRTSFSPNNELSSHHCAIEKLERRLLQLPQVECELIHHFAPGVYARELRRKAGTFIIGHAHRHRHLNILLSGKLTVMMNGELSHFVAPCVFTSEPFTRKITYAPIDASLITIHPTQETDLDKLEEELIEKSDVFLKHEDMIQFIRAAREAIPE